MAKQIMEYRRLCFNCKNAGDCTIRKDWLEPSLYCEEFEVDINPLATATGLENSLPAVEVDAEYEADELIGLCSNCEARKSCVFPKPEGGIWHCEEYQ